MSFAILQSSVTQGFLILVVVYFAYKQYNKSRYLTTLPWLGTSHEPLSFILPRFRARIQNVINFKQALTEGYTQYASKGLTCVLPTIADDIILLPPQELSWIVSQPDHVLSIEDTHVEGLQTDYTFPDPHIVRSPTHHHVVSTDLTRQLNFLTTDIIDELAHAIDKSWGSDQDAFRAVCVYDTIMQTVAMTSNRVFVGLPLCRDMTWLANAAGFAREVPVMSTLLRQFPQVLRPLLAPLLLRKNNRHTSAIIEQIRPEILRRQNVAASQQDTSGDKAELPNDFLTWLIQDAATSDNPLNRKSEIIAGRLLAVQFAAIHTSTFAMTNCIFDLVSSPDGASYLQQLRDEAESILAQNGGVWTKNGLAKMYKIDSTLRESLRVGSFLGPGVLRTVVAPNGVTSPNGTHCPKDSVVGILSHGVHNDEKNYPDAKTFQPLRFAEQRLESQDDASIEQAEKNPNFIRKANLAFVTTSSTYHPWGHGRHTCPGRFFAANELKLLLAYLVMNYDFELLDTRPESKWLGATLVPPMKASVRIKRRKQEK